MQITNVAAIPINVPLEPIEIQNGSIEVPSDPGLGISVDLDAVEAYRTV